MAEVGLSASETGKAIGEHRGEHVSSGGEVHGSGRRIIIVEAVLLAVVAVLAAWSGYGAAKWGTEGQLSLAQASAARTEASQANLDAMELRNLDSSAFDAWFTAYVAKNAEAQEIAEKRFRPDFRVAFEAWQAASPATNPNAPPGPTFMRQYRQPGLGEARALEAKATALFNRGADAASTADSYVRITVLLASVLFLVGISGHFRVRVARLSLVGLGGVIMLVALTIIVLSPKPPA